MGNAIANLLVFINAHLAFNQANQVAIIASHTQRAEFLYPSRVRNPAQRSTNGTAGHADEDVEMADASEAHLTNPQSPLFDDANKYRPFRLIEETLLASLSRLISMTSPDSLTTTPTASIAGALTLALTYINKQTTILSSAIPTTSNPSSQSHSAPSLLSRILILSVSGDLAYQYIPIMNTIFACQRLSIPIDIAKIAGDTVFLQQASDATRGTYIKLDHPEGLLQYLMMGFLPDQTSRRNLISPTQVGVDFRAACFCHRDVVDIGYVCSICLSSTYDDGESPSMPNEVSLKTSSLLLPPGRSALPHLRDSSFLKRLRSHAGCDLSEKEETEDAVRGMKDFPRLYLPASLDPRILETHEQQLTGSDWVARIIEDSRKNPTSQPCV